MNALGASILSVGSSIHLNVHSESALAAMMMQGFSFRFVITALAAWAVLARRPRQRQERNARREIQFHRAQLSFTTCAHRHSLSRNAAAERSRNLFRSGARRPARDASTRPAASRSAGALKSAGGRCVTAARVHNTF